jgi:hypothetical protein
LFLFSEILEQTKESDHNALLTSILPDEPSLAVTKIFHFRQPIAVFEVGREVYIRVGGFYVMVDGPRIVQIEHLIAGTGESKP